MSRQSTRGSRIHRKGHPSITSEAFLAPPSMIQRKLTPHYDQGRIANIQDVPALAPYFFVDPNYSTLEARSIYKYMPNDDYRERHHSLTVLSYASSVSHLTRTGRALDATIHRLESKPDIQTVSEVSSLVHIACDTTGLKQKVFMTALRHALTAMKVFFSICSYLYPCTDTGYLPQAGPSVPETVNVLGVERSIVRLKDALVNSHTL